MQIIKMFYKFCVLAIIQNSVEILFRQNILIIDSFTKYKVYINNKYNAKIFKIKSSIINKLN